MKRKYSQEEVEQLMNGRIYINPDDLNIFVKRGMCAWTINLGNKWAWVIITIWDVFILLISLIWF